LEHIVHGAVAVGLVLATIDGAHVEEQLVPSVALGRPPQGRRRSLPPRHYRRLQEVLVSLVSPLFFEVLWATERYLPVSLPVKVTGKEPVWAPVPPSFNVPLNLRDPDASLVSRCLGGLGHALEGDGDRAALSVGTAFGGGGLGHHQG
jgi:hypothetical protein